MLIKGKLDKSHAVLVIGLLLSGFSTLAQQLVVPDTSTYVTQNSIPSLQAATATISQKPELPLEDTIYTSPTPKPQSFKDFLKQGKFSGHIRNYFMYTHNTHDYPDFHALAMGAGLYYESPIFHGFQAGVGGFFVFNVFSSDLGKDPVTQLGSRYEIGLFDLLNPEDKHDLGRMESLFLRYNINKSKVTLGRQKVVTPFLNPQDGRMRPTLVNALWLEIHELQKLQFQGGWVFGVGPRSTQDFFTVEESIGSISVGRSAYGGPSQFKDNISSAGMAVGHLTYMPVSALKTSLTHYYADNLFNFTFSQTDLELPVNQDIKTAIVLGFQAGYQTATGDGGNKDPLKAYIEQDAETWLYSARLGYKTPVFFTSLNYTRIGDGNRWLFPREWGIEGFYTFMPRERLEGTANTRMVSLLTDFNLSKRWKARLGYGLAELPDVMNLAQNKYGMPSFSQLQVMTNYNFQGKLDGMALQVLYIYKGERGNTYDTPNFIVNKVDMSHLSLVMNYTF